MALKKRRNGERRICWKRKDERKRKNEVELEDYGKENIGKIEKMVEKEKMWAKEVNSPMDHS